MESKMESTPNIVPCKFSPLKIPQKAVKVLTPQKPIIDGEKIGLEHHSNQDSNDLNHAIQIANRFLSTEISVAILKSLIAKDDDTNKSLMVIITII